MGGQSALAEDDPFLKPTESTRGLNWQVSLVEFTRERMNFFRYPQNKMPDFRLS